MNRKPNFYYQLGLIVSMIWGAGILPYLIMAAFAQWSQPGMVYPNGNPPTPTRTPTSTFTPTNTPTYTPTYTWTNTPVPPTNTSTPTYTRTNTPVLPTNTPTFTPTTNPNPPMPIPWGALNYFDDTNHLTRIWLGRYCNNQAYMYANSNVNRLIIDVDTWNGSGWNFYKSYLTSYLRPDYAYNSICDGGSYTGNKFYIDLTDVNSYGTSYRIGLYAIPYNPNNNSDSEKYYFNLTYGMTNTPTPIGTPSYTPTSTPTPTPTATNTNTPMYSPTITPTTNNLTPTYTPTPTPTQTLTPDPTRLGDPTVFPYYLPGAGDQFGYSVALSGDVAVIGAPYHDPESVQDAGAAYVYERIYGDWYYWAKLTASDGAAGDHFGYSVAISGDTIVVGAPHHDRGTNADAGAAYVFVRGGDYWDDMTEDAQLTASDGGALAGFGASVSIYGTNIVVGAPLAKNPSGNDVGSAYVFTQSGSEWITSTETAKLRASDASLGDQFGLSVSIAANAIAVGAPGRAQGTATVRTLCASH